MSAPPPADETRAERLIQALDRADCYAEELAAAKGHVLEAERAARAEERERCAGITEALYRDDIAAAIRSRPAPAAEQADGLCAKCGDQLRAEERGVCELCASSPAPEPLLDKKAQIRTCLSSESDGRQATVEPPPAVSCEADRWAVQVDINRKLRVAGESTLAGLAALRERVEATEKRLDAHTDWSEALEARIHAIESRPQPAPATCKTCGGTRWVYDDNSLQAVHVGARLPCPDCQQPAAQEEDTVRVPRAAAQAWIDRDDPWAALNALRAALSSQPKAP